MKKDKVFKIIIVILTIIILAYITIELLPLFKGISTLEGRMQLKEEISGLGIKGIFMILGLIFAQIFLAFLPGEPVELLAGMCYGPIGGLMVVFLGSFLSSLIIFFCVRKFGKKFIYSFVKKEQIDKIENSKWFSDTKKIDITLFILFFVPGTPKDLLTYIGGLLPIKTEKFLIISTFARFPSIISSTIAGSNIIDGNWHIIAIVYVASFIISAIIIAVFTKKNKNNYCYNKDLMLK